MKVKKHLVYLGLSGFPKGFAAIQRQKYISKALLQAGWDVTIICNRGVHSESDKIERTGVVESINYHYIFDPIRPSGTFVRNILKIVAPFAEFRILMILKKRKGITAGIITDRNLLWDAIKYRLFSLIIGFDIYLNLVELYQDRPNQSVSTRINDYVFNKFGCYFYDGILPISKYLMGKIEKFNKRNLIIPVVTDTSVFTEIKVLKSDHILYCGSASYYEAIKSVLISLSLVTNTYIKLILVVGGTENQMKKIFRIIENLKLQSRVEIKSGITNSELNDLYCSARALLLPLFNTIQDNARFPHKFGEYLASGTLVITNPIGEINDYLVHLESGIFYQPNDNYDMAHWIDWVIANEVKSKKIGKKGQEIAKRFFDFSQYSEELSTFLNAKGLLDDKKNNFQD